MPSKGQLLWGDLEKTWEGHFKRRGGNIYLSWGIYSDLDNHIHIYVDDTENVWKYSVKCNGNLGESRIHYYIDPNQSLDMFVDELEKAFRRDCPGIQTGGYKYKYLKYKQKYKDLVISARYPHKE